MRKTKITVAILPPYSFSCSRRSIWDSFWSKHYGEYDGITQRCGLQHLERLVLFDSTFLELHYFCFHLRTELLLLQRPWVVDLHLSSSLPADCFSAKNWPSSCENITPPHGAWFWLDIRQPSNSPMIFPTGISPPHGSGGSKPKLIIWSRTITHEFLLLGFKIQELKNWALKHRDSVSRPTQTKVDLKNLMPNVLKHFFPSQITTDK